MNRYESNLKNTSPVIDDIRNEFARMPRGVFDLSHRVNFDASDGFIIPIDYHELVPNSDLYLSYDVSLLSHNPTFRRLLSGASIELRTYKRLKSDSWKGWNNFVTKGRTGKVAKSIPYVDFTLGSLDNDSNVNQQICTLTPHSPACYLGFVPSVFLGVDNNNYQDFVKSRYPQRWCYNAKSNPPYNISDYVSGLTGITSISQVLSSDALKISALPLVFYNSIVKDFQDLNLLINEQSGTFSPWCPENEDNDCILPYEATGKVVSSEFNDWYKPITNSTWNFTISQSSRPYLNMLYPGNKRGDYFDTGSPFPDLLRGDIPTIELIESTTVPVDWSDVVADTTGTRLALGIDANEQDPTLTKLVAGLLGTHGGNIDITDSGAGDSSVLLSALNKAKVSSSLVNSLKFSMNQWRQLATLTVFAERMARTDGSYNELIKAQFGHNPNWHGHQPTFCGGSRQPLVFSEVVQQSASDSNGTPLGTTAGRSVSSQQNNSIKIHTDDYCDVMTVMIIRPDEYYCQGVDKRVSRLENIEQYFPILNNLAPDATKNKELFVSGTNSTDEDVFNYQERFAFLKSLRNRVSGLMALPSSNVGSIGEYVKHRIFSQTPNFNLAFTQESEDVNMKSIYTSSIESEYVLNVGIYAKLIAPIPEVTTPSDMGISY